MLNSRTMSRTWFRKRCAPTCCFCYILTMSFEFTERYMSLNKTNLQRPSQSQPKNVLASTIKQRRVNMDDTESEGADHDGDYDAEKPWLAEWNRYEKTREAVPESMGIV